MRGARDPIAVRYFCETCFQSFRLIFTITFQSRTTTMSRRPEAAPDTKIFGTPLQKFVEQSQETNPAHFYSRKPFMGNNRRFPLCRILSLRQRDGLDRDERSRHATLPWIWFCYLRLC